ncbi:MAG: sigma-70 family RNA polymerase sigma factor [Candidatus Latescibacteria bacterium]|nr:sigma-70 family RNA polymerase sigma factor [bacterium]MBD3424265.1 sigma-70 family RNA polymerase sigma factor [Candidatus Latescibacterota bacterium]
MIDDAELMERTAAGDSEAFSLIVERYSGQMYNFFIRSTGSREDAEDLLQNLFLALYRSARRYRKTASFRTYIYRIASNMLVSHYRRSRKLLSVDSGDEDKKGIDLPDHSAAADPERSTRLSQLEEGFSRALADLPVETAAALELRVKSGFSYREIAEIMDKSLPAVESMIFRGRKFLAERMREFRDDPGE